MANVHLFITPAPHRDVPYQLIKSQEMSRIPCVGEVLFLGVDEHGDGADYEVVFVHHMCLENNPGVHAEIYMTRVDAEKLIRARVKAATEGPNFVNKPGNPTFKN